IAYIDHNHLSATFAETLGPIVKADVIEILSEETNRPVSSEESTDEKEENVENKSNNSLLDLKETEKGWINFEGEVGDNAEYRITPKIDYNPDKNYEINIGAYISYYNNDEFIKTIQQAEGIIEKVEEADSIIVSYHYTFENKMLFKEK